MKGKFQDGPPNPDAPKSKFVYEEQGTAPVAVENQLASVLNVATQKSSEVVAPSTGEETDIEVGHARAITGNDITVAVTAGHGQTITSVSVRLDGVKIGDDSPHSKKYRRHFEMQGSASPGMRHEVYVVVADSAGLLTDSIDSWQDLN